MNALDKRLNQTFASLGDTLSRATFLKRASVLTAAVVGVGAAAETATAAPSLCADNHGRCNGCLCCGDYNGCRPETPYYCGYTPSGCGKYTGRWTACCNSYWLYEWWDCCFRTSGGSCCNGVQGRSNCVSGSCPSWCGGCYWCTFRIITANGC